MRESSTHSVGRAVLLARSKTLVASSFIAIGRRGWIKIDGKQVEFNGEARMSDPGWFQTFRAEGFAVTMRVRRTGDHGDGVSMVGQIIIERRGVSKTYEVKGGCGA